LFFHLIASLVSFFKWQRLVLKHECAHPCIQPVLQRQQQQQQKRIVFGDGIWSYVWLGSLAVTAYDTTGLGLHPMHGDDD
jgi:hypothetical protein